VWPHVVVLVLAVFVNVGAGAKHSHCATRGRPKNFFSFALRHHFFRFLHQLLEFRLFHCSG
jgi:hypothetical protein